MCLFDVHIEQVVAPSATKPNFKDRLHAGERTVELLATGTGLPMANAGSVRTATSHDRETPA